MITSARFDKFNKLIIKEKEKEPKEPKYGLRMNYMILKVSLQYSIRIRFLVDHAFAIWCHWLEHFKEEMEELSLKIMST